MKNILAENMLRFRSKNIAAQEAAAIRKLIEQQTSDTKKYKNPTDIDGFFDDTAAGAIPLNPNDVQTVIFTTRLGTAPALGAVSGDTNAIQLEPGLYLAVGQISTVRQQKSVNVKPVVTPKGRGAVLFFAGPDATQQDSAKYGAYTTVGYVRPISFIPYDGNDLAKCASDIIRGTKPGPTEKASDLAKMAPRIAAVFKAAVGLGINGADRLNDTKFYDKWQTDTKEYLAGT